jgi:hypothetical protein
MRYLTCPRCHSSFHTGAIYEALEVCPRCGASLYSPRPNFRRQLRGALKGRPAPGDAPDWEAITGSQYTHRRVTRAHADELERRAGSGVLDDAKQTSSGAAPPHRRDSGLPRGEWPPLDFPLYGLDDRWSGPRWLEHLEGAMRQPAVGVWLAHSDRRTPVRGHPWVLVGSFRPTSDEHGLISEMAWTGLRLLMNVLSPDVEERDRDRFWRNSMIYLKRRAARHESWTAAHWTVDGHGLTARFARFAGGWTGHGIDTAGVGVAVVATSISPHRLTLTRVRSGRSYKFALEHPVTHPDTLERSAEQALGSHAWERTSRRWHTDQRKLLKLNADSAA